MKPSETPGCITIIKRIVKGATIVPGPEHTKQAHHVALEAVRLLEASFNLRMDPRAYFIEVDLISDAVEREWAEVRIIHHELCGAFVFSKILFDQSLQFPHFYGYEARVMP